MYIVAKRSPVSATAECLFSVCHSFTHHLAFTKVVVLSSYHGLFLKKKFIVKEDEQLGKFVIKIVIFKPVQ